jgi:hypothetical protein
MPVEQKCGYCGGVFMAERSDVFDVTRVGGKPTFVVVCKKCQEAE